MLGWVRKILFFLIIFCVPFQVGLHFWPNFSYVGGVRIDYLSPTLYLLDILIFLFILFSLREILKTKIDFKKESIFLKAVFILFVLDVILNVFLSKSTGAHIYGIAKLAEFGLFGWLVARTVRKQDIPIFVRILSFSAIISSVLAIWQFINQSSVGGLWYYLGERIFNSSTIGISTVNLDHQILRSYGAFPHPNILAFFLLATICFVLMRISHEKNYSWKIFLIVSVLFSVVGLALTFSRTAIVLTIGFVAYAIYAKGKRNIGYFVAGGLSLTVFLGLFLLLIYQQPFLLRGIDFREELLAQSFTIFQNSPYFGIGLNNFFVNQAPLIKTISPTNFQPPHNIFVLALLSLGVLGWWIVPVGLVGAVREVWGKIHESRIMNHELRDFNRGILFILISIIIVGMFDHFFLTLEQGQIMLALILGLSFVDLRRKT